MLAAARTQTVARTGGLVLRAAGVSTWSHVPAGPPDPILGAFTFPTRFLDSKSRLSSSYAYYNPSWVSVTNMLRGDLLLIGLEPVASVSLGGYRCLGGVQG